MYVISAMTAIFLISVVLCVFTTIFGLLMDASKTVTVHAPVGDIVGKFETFSWAHTQFTVKEFLGIPYAEAPLGQLRLKKPIPKVPFKSPFLAFDFGPACLQNRGYVAKTIALSEDCLFLNIYVPDSVNTSRGPTVPGTSNTSDTMFPVMIFIHGGGFMGGVSTYYSGDVLATFGQVIVVTINYRLAHMGFLWTNEAFENFGLWDQRVAFQWVKDNIASFGGDNSKITIFGESAGSESVVYQVLYRGNKGLFQRAIAESMSINSGRAFVTNGYASKLVANFAQVVGCNASPDDIVACIRNKTTDEIKNATRNQNLIYEDVHPVKDNDFVPKHPNDMITSPSSSSLEVFYDIDFMMGSTSIDGALYLGDWAKRLNITDLEKFKVPRNVYETEFIPDELAYHFTDIKTISDEAKKMTVYVYTNWTVPDDDLARNFMLVDYFSDSRMFLGMVSTIQLHSKSDKGRTYMYEFSIKPTTHLIPVPKWLDGPGRAIHADDTFFVFGYDQKMVNWFRAAGAPITYTDKDIESAKVVMTMWSNFAKIGYVICIILKRLFRRRCNVITRA